MKEKSKPWKSTFRLTKFLQIVRLVLLLSIVTNYSALASSVDSNLQSRVIKGTVIDAAGDPLPGVNIVVKGTTVGTITDGMGTYSISVNNPQATLVFTFVGYVSQEIAVGDKLVVDVTLAEDVKSLEEVVVVGYGVQKKETVVGAIAQVDNKDLVKAGTTNITNALSGKLSGVLTMQQSGQPGDNDAEIIVRGLSSWNGSQPLVLVDGVERDFSDLDPNEINSISVLKDASATAVFGAKGANGVIIVSTKRGTLGKPKVDISASYGIERATRIPDHIDSYTTMQMYNYGLKNQKNFAGTVSDAVLQEYRQPSSLINSLRYPNVDWFDELTKPFAPTATANFNITGGTEFVKYFCSLGYQYEGDLFKSEKQGYLETGYKYNKLNYRANLDFALTSTTKLGFNIGGDFGVQNQPKNSPWRNLYQTSPARFPAYFPDWALELIPDPDYPNASGRRMSSQLSEYTGNPYNQFFQGDFNQYTNSKLFTDLMLDQSLDGILQGLSVKGKVSVSTYYKMRTLYSDYSTPKYSINYDDIGVPGRNPWVRESQNDKYYIESPLDLNVGGLEGGYYTDLYYEAALNYVRSFGKHNVSALALFNRQQKNKESDFAYYNEGWVGRATYDFSRKYQVEFNLGYTGSERFAPKNRFGFFPSAAVGWIISEEDFFKNNISWMNKFKVRYSDGMVGSDVAGERWLYQSSYFKDAGGKILEDKIANSTAQWETAHKRDIGIEMGFFDVLHFNIDLYDEYRENILLDPRTVTFFVGNTFKSMNLGKTKKHGFEIEGEFKKTTAFDLYYYVKGMVGFNENRIIFKDDLPYAPEHMQEAGKPMGSQLDGAGLVDGGYYTSVDDIHNYVTPVTVEGLNVGDYKFLDYSANGNINNMDQYPIAGNLYAPIVYSFSGGLNYKNFDFNIMFSGQEGKYVNFNQIYESEFVKGSLRVHAAQQDYWTPTNRDANHATLHYYGTGDNPQMMWGGGEADRGYALMINNRTWRNASFLRLKEIYVGYNINSKGLERLAGIGSLLVYCNANNLYTFTNLIEGDPERKDFQQGFYPPMMSVKVGLKVNF